MLICFKMSPNGRECSESQVTCLQLCGYLCKCESVKKANLLGQGFKMTSVYLLLSPALQICSSACSTFVFWQELCFDNGKEKSAELSRLGGHL